MRLRLKPKTLFRLFVRRVLPARIAKLLGLQTVGVLLLVFGGGVIAILAFTTLQRNDFAHFPGSFLRAQTGLLRRVSTKTTR
jgi:hypothetical protein